VSGLRTYIIVYDATKPGVSPPAIHQYIVDSKDIVAWMSYIPLVHFVKTRLEPAQLAGKLTVFLQSTYFVVAEVTAYNVNGLLPKPGWDWFYFDHERLLLPSSGTASVGSIT